MILAGPGPGPRPGSGHGHGPGRTLGAAADRTTVTAADRGSGSILVVAAVLAILLFTGLLVPLAQLAVARHRAAAAADAAALAAADALVGVASGDPCGRAAELAAANGAELLRCVPDGLVVTVRVVAGAPPIVLAADATAGPPG